jgi:ubiquinone/menaquinone biosynthesis C-methylase UbiE
MDKNKIAVALFDKLAHGYQEKYMDVALYHDTLDWFCENLQTPNASILELACGPGNITKYLLEQRPDFKIIGTDLAPKMIELAAINNPNAQFQLMDCRELASHDAKYDGVMCCICLWPRMLL